MAWSAQPLPLQRNARHAVCIAHINSRHYHTQVLEFEAAYLRALPSAAMYERSYMHRDTITHVAVARAVDFIITGTLATILHTAAPHTHHRQR